MSSDIRILRVSPDKNKAQFEIAGQPILQTEGLAALVQIVINHLMTSRGSDRLNPERGAGLARLCRRHRTNSQELQEKIASYIEETESQIRQEQSQLQLPPEEKLQSLSLLSAKPDEENPTVLNINVAVRSEAGDETRIVV